MKLFGRIRREHDLWVIAAEPHVILRLKRVFGKVTPVATATVRLSDTEENARDLLWFLERYPMEVEDRKYLERRAAQHVARTEAIQDLLSGRYEPPEFVLAHPPRRYQRLAAEVLLRGRSLLLADDVGLGKTVTAICTLTDPRALPALVVTLAHLPRQWQDEVTTFAPKLRTHVVRKTKPYDIRVEGQFPDVLLMNYHKLAGWADVLGQRIKTVIFDEVQELRHRGSAKYEAAAILAQAAQFRLGLSATPIYNYGGEIWNVLDVLRPGALGEHDEFVREWCAPGMDPPRIVDPRAFGTWAREQGLVLRRTRASVGRELPALTKVPHHVDSDAHVLDRIGSSAAELARVILQQNEEHRGQRMQASEALSTMLRQATGIAKAAFVADFVRLLVESGERVVLFGWHREVYGIWMDRLADLKPALFTGSESLSQKDAARTRFVDRETDVLIMSLRAGAGLDGIQHVCRTIVFGELDWSPGVHEQCIGRVYRDGQKEPVVAYFLIADHGADPVIADVLSLKRQQVDGVRDPLAEIVEPIDVGEGKVRRLAEDYLRQLR